MSLKNLAIIFSLVFIIIGTLGFSSFAASDGYLFGLFHVNSALNIVHILSGVFAFICATLGETASRKYFKLFGIIYGILSLVGLIIGDHHIFVLISNNFHDVWLHTMIACGACYLGYFYYDETPTLF